MSSGERFDDIEALHQEEEDLWIDPDRLLLFTAELRFHPHALATEKTAYLRAAGSTRHQPITPALIADRPALREVLRRNLETALDQFLEALPCAPPPGEVG